MALRHLRLEQNLQRNHKMRLFLSRHVHATKFASSQWRTEFEIIAAKLVAVGKTIFNMEFCNLMLFAMKSNVT